MCADSKVVNAVQSLIDGAGRHSLGEETVDIINPSNGSFLFSIPCGAEGDAEDAVVSARAAFDDGCWSGAQPSQRKRVLRRFADLVEANAVLLDRLDAVEMGKPLSVGYCNAAAAAGLIRFYAECVDKVEGSVFPSDPTTVVFQRRVPRGVVAAITPWNFPTYNAALKAAPALAAGNTVILKPSELSSRSALELNRLAHEAGLPEGALNTVIGLGQTVGTVLARHPNVDMVTFTGSTATGKKILEYAAQSNMKHVMAECGGKSPQIVFDDGVDIDAAAAFIAGLLVTNQGQLCSVGSRLLVQRSLQDRLVDKIVKALAGVVIGDPTDAATTFGPLAAARQLERVMGYIDSAVADGIPLAVGGRQIRQESGGFFVEPTVFLDVDPAAPIAQQEIFGPVLAVTPFDDEAEAIRLANGTDFGLAAYVWTACLGTGMRMAKQVRSSVLVNAAAPAGEGAGFAMSAEAFGQSGVGVESGVAGMESYMQRHTAWINHG